MRTGMFEKAGLQIELSMMGSGNAITAAVAGGALDIGLSSLVAIIQGHLRGIPLTIVAPGGLWVDARITRRTSAWFRRASGVDQRAGAGAVNSETNSHERARVCSSGT